MPLYAVSVVDQDVKIYEGHRIIEEGDELADNESLILYNLADLSDWTLRSLPKTPEDKLRELTALISTLDDETQADLIDDSGRIIDALTFGKVGVAKVLVGRIATNGDAQLEGLKSAVLAILRS